MRETYKKWTAFVEVYRRKNRSHETEISLMHTPRGTEIVDMGQSREEGAIASEVAEISDCSSETIRRFFNALEEQGIAKPITDEYKREMVPDESVEVKQLMRSLDNI